MTDESGEEVADAAAEGKEEKFVPPKDGSWIPKARFDEAVNAERARLTRVEAELAALRQAQPKPKQDETKRYSRAELNAAVAANTITAEQSDEIWAKQIREDAKREAKAEVLGIVEETRARDRVDSDLQEYKQLVPEIMEEGSDTRQRVREEFEYLVSLGHSGASGDPKTLQTQLLAIRAVLGPIEKLRMAKSARREIESEEQTGGSSSGARRSTAKSAWDALDKRQKEHYENAIRNGLYKNKAEVEAELTFTRKPNRGRRAA